MNEIDLITAIQRGDPRALEYIIDKYSGYVMAVVEHTLGKQATQEDKEELVADTFVSLWKNADALEANSRLKAWLAVVARNAAINKAQSLRPEETLSDDFVISDPSSASAPVELKEQAYAVRAAIGELKEEDQELFMRHYFYYQSIPDIAAETGINPSTIKSRLFRGRQVLRAILVQKGYSL